MHATVQSVTVRLTVVCYSALTVQSATVHLTVQSVRNMKISDNVCELQKSSVIHPISVCVWDIQKSSSSSVSSLFQS